MNLTILTPTRNGLRHHFGSSNFYANCGNCGYRGIYSVKQVRAYSDLNITPGGALAGGLIGLIGGPIGLVIGGVLGGALGSANDNEDRRKANVFNASF